MLGWNQFGRASLRAGVPCRARPEHLVDVSMPQVVGKMVRCTSEQKDDFQVCAACVMTVALQLVAVPLAVPQAEADDERLLVGPPRAVVIERGSGSNFPFSLLLRVCNLSVRVSSSCRLRFRLEWAEEFTASFKEVARRGTFVLRGGHLLSRVRSEVWAHLGPSSQGGALLHVSSWDLSLSLLSCATAWAHVVYSIFGCFARKSFNFGVEGRAKGCKAWTPHLVHAVSGGWTT